MLAVMFCLVTLTALTACGEETPVKKDVYTFTFDVNYEGGNNRVDNVKAGYSANYYAARRSGYTLVNWYTTKDCVTPFDFSTKIEKDYTVYALWDKKGDAVDVTFNYNYDKCFSPVTVEGEQGKIIDAKTVPDPKRLGYEVEGWYTDKDCTRKWNLETDKLTGNIDLYAKYNKTANLKFDGNGKVILKNVEVNVSIQFLSWSGKRSLQEIVDDFNDEYAGKVRINWTTAYTNDEASGKYVAADDKVFPGDVNIKPFIAIQTIDHGKSLYAPSNAASYQDMLSWLNVFTDCWIWSYGSAYNDYFCFVDNYSFYADLVPVMVKNNVQMSLIQQHSNQRGSDTGFFNLSAYVDCKLRWNASLKIEELIDKYFDGMYLDAADEMKEYYLLCKLWFADALRTERVWSNAITGKSDYFDIGTIKAMFAKLDKAYDAIEVYRRDEAVYDKLKTNIDTEWLFPAKTAISDNFSDYFTSAELSAMKTKFKSVCVNIGLTKMGEAMDLSGFLSVL